MPGKTRHALGQRHVIVSRFIKRVHAQCASPEFQWMLCEATGIAGKGSSDIIPYNLHLEIRNIDVEAVIMPAEGSFTEERS